MLPYGPRGVRLKGTDILNQRDDPVKGLFAAPAVGDPSCARQG